MRHSRLCILVICGNRSTYAVYKMETARPILDKAKRLAKINTKFYVCLTFSPILMLIL